MWKLFSGMKRINQDLRFFKDEPLTSFSFILLIILDLFIFTNVQIGISHEAKKEPKSYVYYPQQCINHFDKPQEGYGSFVGSVNQFNTYTYAYPSTGTQSPYCNNLDGYIQVVKSDQFFSINQLKLTNLDKMIDKISVRIQTIRDEYNTQLFEKIAEISTDKKLIEVKKEYQLLITEKSRLEKELHSVPSVKTLNGYGEYKKYVIENRTEFYKAKEKYNFWQPFYEYMRVSFFLLPLLIIFGWIYLRASNRSLRGEGYNPVVKIISGHISVVLMLPMVWYTLVFIYDIVPKTFFKKLMEYLIELGLLNLLNYAAIGLVVVVFGFIIFWLQKSAVKNKTAQTFQNRSKLISFSQCFECGYKVNYTLPFCPNCATKLLHKCEVCNENIPIHISFCSHCGSPNHSPEN